jgi:hypothetical protein
MNAAAATIFLALLSSLAAAVPLALDRILLCPRMNDRFGPAVLGEFLWFLAVVNVLGSAIANGYAIHWLRSLAGLCREAKTREVRTGLRQVVRRTGLVLSLATVACLCLSPATGTWLLASIYLPLALYALCRAVLLLVVTVLQIERYFAQLLLMRLIESLMVAALTGLLGLGSLMVMGAGYVATLLVPLAVGVRSRPLGNWRQAPLGEDRPAPDTMAWIPGAWMTVVDQGNTYLGRFLLGLMAASPREITVLFAGTSVGMLFVMPMSLLGATMMSLLGGKRPEDVSRRVLYAYGGVSLLAAALVGWAVDAIGRPLIAWMYPGLAAEVQPFFAWIVGASVCSTLVVLVRPVAIKYARARSAVAVPTVALAVQFLAIGMLAKWQGVHGVAVGAFAGTLVAAVLWLVLAERAVSKSFSRPFTAQSEGDLQCG